MRGKARGKRGEGRVRARKSGFRSTGGGSKMISTPSPFIQTVEQVEQRDADLGDQRCGAG
jgi:hypothetical protein